MHAIMGATGKVGRRTIEELRLAGQPVRAVLRRAELADVFTSLGCSVAVADFNDISSLTAALEGANSVQMICPVAGRAAEAGGEMRQHIDNIVTVLSATQPAHVLAISDYGAEQESGTGVTLIFRYLEEALRPLPSKLTLLRSAEHMQNWARVVATAARHGVLPVLHHPLSKKFPTIAAQDVGTIAASVLLQKQARPDLCILHAEGPRRYTSEEVAATLSDILARPVVAAALPRENWLSTLTAAGLSVSYAQMVVELFDAHNAGCIDAETSAGPILRGETELKAVLTDLVRQLPA